MPWKPVPTTTGAWWLPQNVTADRYYFDQSFAEAVVDLARRGGYGRLLDVGAGVGRYVGFYRARGLEASGIDGLNYAYERSNGLVKEVDFTGESNWCSACEVVTCMEVLEHIPRQHEVRVIENLVCSATHRLLLSWAGPAQKGNGHINPRNASYVRELLAQKGWHEDEAETRRLRARSRLPWYRSNAQVFAKQPTR